MPEWRDNIESDCSWNGSNRTWLLRAYLQHCVETYYEQEDDLDASCNQCDRD